MVILILQMVSNNTQISSQQKNGTPEFRETKLPRRIGFHIDQEIILLQKI